ncbi:hypothetical protein QBC34DRAFT_377112 [Podospora aff. communis PSN243]|uniref:Uncharacterized protein n=1 Tax=Podospora aff. communis PSN243 TaxID=3040156 RepID=A0AAV9GXY8_9PEZI|nr:hypothetical protein QBC34DRAFT_377112 [Podospora aff. communis PSN243]
MRFSIIILLFATAVSAVPAADAADMALDKRQCGTVNGPCDDLECNGFNNPNNGLGVCRWGKYAGCPCANICGNTVGPCGANDCAAINFVCQGGRYAGCYCY